MTVFICPVRLKVVPACWEGKKGTVALSMWFIPSVIQSRSPGDNIYPANTEMFGLGKAIILQMFS